ncbi:hypothetical protein ABIC33_000595 [Variovorax sp. 1140]|uniref:hypothetical protein n=1 Tax=Variovorax atrisoli TaxID=3394203 RepID=UPI003396472C
MLLTPEQQEWHDYIVPRKYPSAPFLVPGPMGIQIWQDPPPPPPPERVLLEYPMPEGWKPPRGVNRSR